MRLSDGQPTILLNPQGTCTHTTLQRSSLPPISNALLRNPIVTSQDSVNHGNSTQKPAWIPYVQLRNATKKIRSQDAAMLAHVAYIVSEAGVVFQLQVRAMCHSKLQHPFIGYVMDERLFLQRSTDDAFSKREAADRKAWGWWFSNVSQSESV